MIIIVIMILIMIMIMVMIMIMTVILIVIVIMIYYNDCNDYYNSVCIHIIDRSSWQHWLIVTKKSVKWPWKSF